MHGSGRKEGRKRITPKFYDVGRFKEIVGNTPAPSEYFAIA